MIDNYYSISDLVIKTHLISTVIMVGVIWVIQLLHYPSFHYVEKNNYARFQHFHMTRISFIVLPAMILELGSGILLITLPSFLYDINSVFLIAFLFLIIIWCTTATIFSGLHQKLTNGYDRVLVDKLVNLNWIRTFLWTTRLFLLFSIMA